MPEQVQGLTFVVASSSAAQITMSWQLLTTSSETGGSAITKYLVYSAEAGASPTWALLAEVPPGTSQHTATSLTGGVTYVFKVAAVNLHGPGPFSTELSALAAQAPDPPSAPTTEQVATGVKVAWTAPVANHQAVDAYEVLIADSNGAFSANAALCDGASSPARDDLYCTIPISALTSAPYNLAVGTVIAFKVRARNARGWSADSAANTAGVVA